MDSSQVAVTLVECGAITFRTDPPFIFTSGTESPVYVDNRRLLGFVDARRALVAALAQVASDDGDGFDAVAGTATAGIPWAAWLAEQWGAPLLYVRSTAKGWGHENSVEGLKETGWRAIVIEDLIYSGGSVISSTDRLREAGMTVDTCACIVTYDILGSQSIASAGVTVKALTTVDRALEAAVATRRLSEAEGDVVAAWLAEKRRGTFQQSAAVESKTDLHKQIGQESE